MNMGKERGPFMIFRKGKWYWQKYDKNGKELLALIDPQPKIEKIKQGT